MFKEVRPITDVATNILQKRYFWEGEDSWEDIANRVVDYVLKDEQDMESKELTRRMILNRYFVPSSPVLANSGKKDANLNPCFTVDFSNDSIEGIYETKLNSALVTKKGGGVGLSLSKIRPEGEKVSGSAHGYAAGPINFFDTICKDLEILSQGGFRAAAIIGVMSIYHPDIIKFIKAKTNGEKLTNSNISVLIDNAFMEKVKRNEVYSTFFDLQSGRKYYDEYNAKDVFDLIVDGMWKNGEPGLLFYNRINDSPYKYSGQEIASCNVCGELPMPDNSACLSKDSLLMTKDGIRKISGFLDGEILSNYKGTCVIRPAKAFKTKVSKLLNITIDGGLIIKTTPDHKFITDKGEIEAKDLITSKAKIKWLDSNPLITKKSSIENNIYCLLGWMHGDGWFTENSVGISFNNKDGDFEIKDILLKTYHKIFGGNRTPLQNNDISYQEQTDKLSDFNILKQYGVVLSRSTDRELPATFFSWKLQDQLIFLSALFTADGWVGGKTKSIIGYASSSIKLIEQLQQVLGSLGIQSRKNRSTFKTNRKDQYRILISKESSRKFMRYIGFINNKKNAQFYWNPKEYSDKKSLKVISIEYLNEEEIVYDFNVPHTNNGYINGILVHNCNLASIDISKFLNDDLTIDLDSLETCTRLGVRFLDKIIDVTFYPTKEIEKTAKKNRPIGLSLMGFADYFLLRKIAYGSSESVEELSFILDFIYKIAKDESISLGNKLGVPQNCKKLPVPRRNITLMCFAPTGTVAIIAGCSHSLEPIFSEITIRTDKTGTYNMEHPLYKEPYFRCAVSANGAKEVTWREHILIQAAAQKFIDGAVSKTINFPNHTHRDTIYEALISAWESGCKGITVYRSGSREKEVLTPKNLKKDKCPICGKELIRESSCKRCPDESCGFSLCDADIIK